MSKGRVTIPTDASFVEGTREIAAKWGADAVWDSEGASLPDCASSLADKVYGTYFVARGDNAWAEAHEDDAHRAFLMSDRVVAFDEKGEIFPMKGYFARQIDPDWSETARWQVFDRTTGKEVKNWKADKKRGAVTFAAEPCHEYTVNFLARLLWNPTHLFNYMVNHWTCERDRMYDPACPATADYVRRHMKEWCDSHPEIDVVRFTTFLYHFTLVFNEEGKEKYNDWFGYAFAAHPRLLDAFEKEYGYALTSEDLVDKGYYNNVYRIPTKKYRDYMDFVCRFVSKTVRDLVDTVHASGKEAMMFLGDDWIGAEPYGDAFKDMDLDAVVGSVSGGASVRRLSEIPHVRYREGRFIPYFFPRPFFDGNEENVVANLDRNWLSVRRALLRKPLDRMGFGGYLALAAKFPKFVDRVAEVCEEFRSIVASVNGEKPYSALRVGFINCWGKLRSWMCSYSGELEALSGLPVDVEFLSFEDVKNGKAEGLDVLINAGAAYTAYSGGEEWLDERLTTAVRKFVREGGGFVGIGEPTAVQSDGKYFRLSDVLGVDEEVGFSLSSDKYNITPVPHEITEGMGEIDFGESVKNVYALPDAKVLDIAVSDRFHRSVNVGEVRMAVNEYGKGRSVYLTGIPYSFQNARLLYKSLIWAARKDLCRAYTDNPAVECNYYPASKKYAIVNNSAEPQTTAFYDLDGKKSELKLSPGEIRTIRG